MIKSIDYKGENLSKYVNLHMHCENSPMDGYSTIAEYMVRAKEIGMPALAITDHGTTAGHREFQRQTKEAGIKPILGVEAYFSPTDRFDRRAKKNREEADSIYNHLIILAKNDNGLKNLQAGNRTAWNEGFYLKPRWDLDLLKQHNEGLIVTSGCLNGPIAQALNREVPDIELAAKWTTTFRDIFGDDFYIEIQSHNPPKVNSLLLSISNVHRVKPIITCDCHHASPDDKIMQEVFLILNTHPKLNKDADLTHAQKMELMERFDYLYPGRKMTFKDFDLYLQSYEEKVNAMKKVGIDRQDIFENTLEIADKIKQYEYVECQDTLPILVESPDNELTNKVMDGLKKKGLSGKPEYVERANHELSIVTDKGFSTYFLILEDVTAWAKSKGIRSGVGRGSGGGSLVNYSLGITDLDPLEHNLIFERFLDPEREDWPDVDWDIQDDRRDEVKQYVTDKYGHVANISTINTYKGKQSLKDAARALGVPYGEVNKAMKVLEGIDEITGHDVIQEFKLSNDRRAKDFNNKYPDVILVAEKLYGRVRGYGMHAAGIIIANKPISEYAPIETRKPSGSDDRVETVGLDYRECEKIGLIKMDFLGVKTLTVVEDCLQQILVNKNIRVNLSDISYDDAGVYNMLSQGKTLGVFQCEQPASTKLIVKMGVNSFNDLFVSNALVRPGAWNAVGEDYLKAKSGKTRGQFIHEDVKYFMDETFGYPIFQEQMMKLTVDLAGFSVTESNRLRRGIGKKKREIIDTYKPQFIEGATKKVSKQLAEKLWKSFEESGAYAFVKAHSVAYSILSYQTAWLKYHYPLEFMCALLRNEKDGDIITDYLLECKSMGINIKLPHINFSDAKFKVEGDSLRMGLSGVKYLSDKLADRIIKKRPYSSYSEFKNYVLEPGSGLNSRVLAALNKFGGAAFEDNPKDIDPESVNYFRNYLYEYLGIPAFETNAITHQMRSTIRPLDDYTDDETFVVMAMVKGIKQKDNWKRIDLVDSTGTAGIFVDPAAEIIKGKMYILLIGNNSIMRWIELDELSNSNEDILIDYLRRPKLTEIPEGQWKILAATSRKTKAGKNMATITVCDQDKTLKTFLVFDSMFAKAKLMARIGATKVIEFGHTKDGTEYLRDIY
jgi:DNA polymerase-3 subunit alpha